MATASNFSPSDRQASVLELLIKTSKIITSEMDLEKLVQRITDIGTEVTNAQFGAFFYNVINAAGEAYVLYTISGVPKEAFSKFPMPRNTAIFAPTFEGTGTVRYDDVTSQPQFGKNAPYFGMPKGHLPVRSYLAVSVISSFNNEVLGGLFFGHPDVGVFTAESEKLIEGIAAQAAIAIGNAKLFEEKKQAQQKLIEQNEVISTIARDTQSDLEMKVRERTLELEKINYDLLQFTSVASHDLKEPLRKISIFSKLLKERGESQLTPDMTKYVDSIIQSSGRMTRLIDDLLYFSRISQSQDAFEKVDLNEILKQILSDLEVLIAEKHATITIKGMPVVSGIPLHLGQVFQNLISNSLKFSYAGRSPEINITCADEKKGDKRFYVITYTDNGIGFANEDSEKIFELFQRLHSKDIYEGTGIGLAIAKRIIVNHGGTLTASAVPDKGARFEIRLPGVGV